jgi:hypothetical protein
MAGDGSRAESLAQDLNKRYPLDTQMQSLWLPVIRGQLALDRKNPADAVNHLQPAAAPIEFGQIGFVANLSCLYPAYVRGEAYLAAGQDADAARVRALAAYKAFLALWEDADPDIRILIAAKAEYAKLQ